MAPCPGSILRVFVPSCLSSVPLWSLFRRSKLAFCVFVLRGNGRHVASTRQEMAAKLIGKVSPIFWTNFANNESLYKKRGSLCQLIWQPCGSRGCATGLPHICPVEGVCFFGGVPHVLGGDLWGSEPRMAPSPGAILRVFAPSCLSSLLLWSPFRRSKLAICGCVLR